MYHTMLTFPQNMSNMNLCNIHMTIISGVGGDSQGLKAMFKDFKVSDHSSRLRLNIVNMNPLKAFNEGP